MNDIKKFGTRKEAKAEIATMHGWDAVAIKMDTYNKDGELVQDWVIECDKLGQYLREDGFVR